MNSLMLITQVQRESVDMESLANNKTRNSSFLIPQSLTIQFEEEAQSAWYHLIMLSLLG